MYITKKDLDNCFFIARNKFKKCKEKMVKDLKERVAHRDEVLDISDIKVCKGDTVRLKSFDNDLLEISKYFLVKGRPVLVVCYFEDCKFVDMWTYFADISVFKENMEGVTV